MTRAGKWSLVAALLGVTFASGASAALDASDPLARELARWRAFVRHTLAAELDLPLRWAMGSPELARAFGDVSAVPTLFVFDASGQAAGSYFGAPPELHA